MRQFKIFAYLTALLMLPFSLSAQESEQSDSLVRLLSAESLQQVKVNGVNYRKAFGREGNPVTFLHNKTYLICDTAFWNMDEKIIDAFGNVKILQDETALTSDKLVYLVDQNLAEFRGGLVQLIDKDHNTLRTRHLDYNTKDSVAIFKNGASMKDKDGQIIESVDGSYDSKLKLFTFEKNVDMFTDSIFIKTNTLTYESEKNLATFGYATDAWKDKNMLSSNAGWYNRGENRFCFNRDVHVMTETQEGWCDTLFFNRTTQDVTMLGNVQVTDTTRSVSAVSGFLEYLDSLSKITLTLDPAIIAETEDEQKGRDTLYFGADTIVYNSVKKCDIDSALFELAKERIKNVEVDPVTEYRRKAAAEAAKQREEENKDDPNNAQAAARKRAALAGAADKPISGPAGLPDSDFHQPASETPSPESPSLPPEAPNPDFAAAKDSLTVAADSLGLPTDSLSLTRDSLSVGTDSLVVGADSLSVGIDSLAVEKDTTKIGFLLAKRNVKVFRRDMQVVCDSLEFCELDSIARLYIDPVIWNEGKRQYIADSIYVLVRNNTMEKANLMSEAFVHIQEDTIHYDQVRGSEVVAYFDEKGGLKRFDSLGGATALFYIEENNALATANKKESKMLSAIFKDGDIDKVYYFEDPKSNAYPVVQMTKEDQTLKGFKWQPEKRPKDKNAVTERILKLPQRMDYLAHPRGRFENTERYFPGYMKEIRVQIARRDSLHKVHEIQAREREDSLKMARKIDSLELADSLEKLRLDSLAVADSLAKLPVESLSVKTDSLAVSSADSTSVPSIATPEKTLSKKEMREQKKAARKKAKEDKWAAKDKRDAEKAAARAARKQAELRANKLRSIQKEDARLEKEREAVEKERQKILKKMAKGKKIKGLEEEAPAEKEVASPVETDNDTNEILKQNEIIEKPLS